MPDKEAFERFYRENSQRVVRACYLMTLDQSVAEDLAAEAFVRLWSHWGGISGDDHAGGYVFKTAMRLCSRQRRRRGGGSIAILVPGDGLDVTLDRVVIGDALRLLPVRQRQAVILRDWLDLPTAEVADVMGARESTVRVHLARGRATLRATLAPEEMDT